MSNATRQRDFRKRQRRGRAVWRVEVAEDELAAFLIDAGLVPEDCADRAIYEKALADLLTIMHRDISVTRYGELLRNPDKFGE